PVVLSVGCCVCLSPGWPFAVTLCCFYCSGHHRHLHSFPTRRSSDLVYMLQWLAGHGVDDVILSCGFQPTKVEEALGDGSDLGIRDRKSTRLNSSHVKISYAVFCLKKKSVRTARKHARLESVPVRRGT